MTKRLNWNETWMQIAEVMAHRSECSLAQVGAVIVNAKNRVIATGYNGPPANAVIGELCELSCPRSHSPTSKTYGYGFGCISIHAEANALLFCDRSTIEGGTIYVTAVPCEDCTKLIANSGLAAVCFIDDHRPHRPAMNIVMYLENHRITCEVM